MRTYKIIEERDGHGNPKFKVKSKYGWGWFSCWEQQGNILTSMTDAQDAVELFMREYKDAERIKVQEYIYTTVPDHVPEEQAGNFMILNQKKK